MTYFLPSFFQKRLLRYALSQLELLETDDLALDKLDIAWGRRSTVELRDVRLRLKVSGRHDRKGYIQTTRHIIESGFLQTDRITLQKLSSLLNLPPSLNLLKARISLLRLTVPADLYKSSILVEVEGVEVLLKTRVAEKEEPSNSCPKSSAGQDGETDRPRNTQLLIHDPGGQQSSQKSEMKKDDTGDSKDTDKLIPTTVDLAQSFLQAEPQAEKEGLEAAIAESYGLEDSFITSESEDEVSAYGIGNALALPTFLADFLRGVGDRVQVKIENVMIDLEVNLDLPLGSSAGSTTSDKSDVVTIRLSIEGIDLKGAAPSRSNPGHEGSQPGNKKDIRDDLSSPITKENRQINLRNLQVMLVSDALLFANLSRFDAPSSPATTQTSSVAQPGCKPLANISRLASSTSSASQRNIESIVVPNNRRNIPTSSTLEASTITNDSERFADVENENEPVEALAPLYASSLEGSRYQDSVLADSFYSSDGDQKLSHMHMNNMTNLDLSQDSKTTHQDPRHHPSAGKHGEQIRLPTTDYEVLERSEVMISSLYSSSVRDPRFSQEPLEDIRKGSSANHGMTDNEYEPPPLHREQSRFFVSAVSENSSSESHSSEDLTRSKIFSHEEAESMYMSAISHASSDDEKSSVTLCGWNPSSSDSEHPSQAIGSPDQDQQGQNKGSVSYLNKNSTIGLGFDGNQPIIR